MLQLESNIIALSWSGIRMISDFPILLISASVTTAPLISIRAVLANYIAFLIIQIHHYLFTNKTKNNKTRKVQKKKKEFETLAASHTVAHHRYHHHLATSRTTAATIGLTVIRRPKASAARSHRRCNHRENHPNPRVLHHPLMRNHLFFQSIVATVVIPSLRPTKPDRPLSLNSTRTATHKTSKLSAFHLQIFHRQTLSPLSNAPPHSPRATHLKSITNCHQALAKKPPRTTISCRHLNSVFRPNCCGSGQSTATNVFLTTNSTRSHLHRTNSRPLANDHTKPESSPLFIVLPLCANLAIIGKLPFLPSYL